MINFNAGVYGVQAIQPIKKREDNSYLTNTIAPQAPQELPKAKVSPQLAQVVFGVQHNFGGKKKGGDESTQWVNSLPFAQDLSPDDRRNLANVIRKKDEETDYMKKMIHMVCKNMVTPMATATLCKHGIMSDYAKKDIDTYYDKVKGQGMSVKDAFVPEFATKAEADKVTPVGDVFRVAGQEKIFVKADDESSKQLEMDADTFLKLYPPVERFAACQGGNGDCYLLSSINSIMENPYTRSTVYGCFKQDGKDVVVSLPDAKTETRFVDGKMPAKTDMEKFTEGPLGMKMLEKAYGVEMEKQTYDKYTDVVNKEYKKMNKDLAKWEKKNPKDALTIKKKKEINQRIANWQAGQAKVDEAMKDPNHELLILTDDYGEFIIGKFGPMTEDVSKVDNEYQSPTDYYTGGLGGYMDEATSNFGFESKSYMVGEDDKEIDKALLAKNPYDYIITAGTYPEGEGMENPQDETYSIYSSHAYKVLPFDDKNGKRMFKVTNPWNQSHAVIMDMDHVKSFFQDFAITQVNDSEEQNSKKRAA
ncbi:MAG: hypothetical protein K6C94_02100 [Candidatus Gastranaerophilales bacterium]|nr:hypothetical protein [Candidatus Gastranaerophilales bacterium]